MRAVGCMAKVGLGNSHLLKNFLTKTRIQGSWMDRFFQRV
jgi:hypothetical protein